MNAIILAYSKEHNIALTMEYCYETILQHVISNISTVMPWYANSQNQFQTPDDVVSAVITYFQTRQYNHPIVDILPVIAADALKFELDIFQQNQGNLQILNYNSQDSEKKIQLLYTNDHYDAIVPILQNEDNVERNYIENENNNGLEKRNGWEKVKKRRKTNDNTKKSSTASSTSSI